MKNERGVVAVLVSLILVVLLGAAAFAIDFGITLHEKRKIHIAADVASLAAVKVLTPGVSDSTVAAEATLIAAANQLPAGDIQSINCGVWSRVNNTFTPASCANAGINAVKVQARRSVNTFFGRVLGVSSTLPAVTSVALSIPSNNDFCIRPFGVESSFLDDPLHPVLVGHEFTIGTDEPGNWGKLDIAVNGDRQNMSSGQNFRDAMTTNVCDASVNIGEVLSQGTGNGGTVKRAFDSAVDAGTAYNMTFAVTSDFGNGNSSVTILEFIRVDLVSQSGRGDNWQGTFRLLERNATPASGGTPGTIDRVLVQ